MRFGLAVYLVLLSIWVLLRQVWMARIVRGFRGDSDSHRMYLLSKSSNRIADVLSVLCLVGVVGGALLSGPDKQESSKEELS
ncbi:protein ABCI12, chloroplastic-like isoform X2 [Euphorbia lathyris]|uniref:protein ABCI12, chloroplastic-like isoform X2 n=1 Tax=Euphorbia lathyris TaxID=212925 RepID=UPI003314096B